LFPEDIEDVSGVSKNISGKTRYTYFDKLLNNDRDVDDFKSQICDVITSGDSYCINWVNNIPHKLNADITLSKVEDMLKNSNNLKSPYIDGLSYKSLKNSRHVLSSHLCNLFNAIHITRMYPDM
jgi:hypothetical protein